MAGSKSSRGSAISEFGCDRTVDVCRICDSEFVDEWPRLNWLC